MKRFYLQIVGDFGEAIEREKPELIRPADPPAASNSLHVAAISGFRSKWSRRRLGAKESLE